MVDLATIARHVGNLTEAQNQLRRAYAIVVSSAGPEHPTALSIEGRLAAVSYRLGEPTDAYDWHIADVGPRVLGADHPAVRGAQQRLDQGPDLAGEAVATRAGMYASSGGWAPADYYEAKTKTTARTGTRLRPVVPASPQPGVVPGATDRPGSSR